MENLNVNQQDDDDLMQLRAAALHLEKEFLSYRKRANVTRETVDDLRNTQDRLPSELITRAIDTQKRNMLNQLQELGDVHEDALVLLFRYMKSIGLLLTCVAWIL